MKTLLLIWSLVLGHCLAGPFFFRQQGIDGDDADNDPGFPDAKFAELGLAVYSPADAP